MGRTPSFLGWTAFARIKPHCRESSCRLAFGAVPCSRRLIGIPALFLFSLGPVFFCLQQLGAALLNFKVQRADSGEGASLLLRPGLLLPSDTLWV